VQADEQALIDAARNGDTGAFTMLVLQHQGRVRTYVGGYLRDPVITDDLCQDVFLQAFRDLRSYRHEAPFRGWLLAIARHRVLDHLRGELRRQQLLGPRGDELQLVLTSWRLAAAEQDGSFLPDRERELAALQRCLEELSGATARIIRAHYFEARTAAAIAEELGRTPSAVRMTLLRVRAALRACVEKRLAVAAPGGVP
jgi:RNA polymerase sigma-70 factor, ECF subfamily